MVFVDSLKLAFHALADNWIDKFVGIFLSVCFLLLFQGSCSSD